MRKRPFASGCLLWLKASGAAGHKERGDLPEGLAISREFALMPCVTKAAWESTPAIAGSTIRTSLRCVLMVGETEGGGSDRCPGKEERKRKREMKIGFGCDHTGFEMKRALMEHLTEKGYECVDYNTPEEEVRVDYPVPGRRVGEAVASGEVDKGVLVCGTGLGISLAANKVPGIRAAVCSEPVTAALATRHNNANIISMGARIVGLEMAKSIVDAFFGAEFEGGRHARRVEMIMDIEKELRG